MQQNIIFKRKIYEKLLEWKRLSNGKSALMIEGARRVGKSTIAEEFAKNEYENYLLIDFYKAPEQIKDIFKLDKENLDNIFLKLQTYYNITFIERKTLIIFDEVQFCKEARAMIKYLVADGRYDYLETGSLISVKENVEGILIPSEEEYVKMYPMDFEEFLWALGDTNTIPYLKKCFDELTPVDFMHRKTMENFMKYVLVGGMPQAIEAYLQTQNFELVDKAKRDILTLYHNDIYKKQKDVQKTLRIYDNIPSQLSSGSKKYKISTIDPNARNQNYEESLTWLDEAKMANLCYSVNEPNANLALTADEDNYKCYQSDTGLLVTQSFYNKPFASNDIYKSILFNKLNINEGMIMENFVAQALKANGYELFYYSKNDNDVIENNMEIDFLISRDKKINPIEVKSGEYKKHTSIDRFKSKFKKVVGTRYVLHTKDIKVEEDIVYLPLYMAMFL